jgi:hypothetical protein
MNHHQINKLNKMDNFSKLSFILLTFLLLICCRKDKDLESDPVVETLQSEIPAEGGVILHGDLSGVSAIEKYGFYYSRDSLFSPYNTNVISFDNPEKSGMFYAEINTNLVPDVVYFFKAFIETRKGLIFGKRNLFLSTGSKPPEITRVMPEIAYLEDTVKIYGKHFGKEMNYYTQVVFSGTSTSIIQLSDSIITCVIHGSSELYEPQLKVIVFDKSDSISFNLYTPVIESIGPMNGTFRDTISITGQHFDKVITRNKVLLGSVPAEIISSSRNKLTFVVPDNLEKSKCRINLTAQLQTVVSEGDFTLLTPVINGMPDCAYSDTEIEIRGRYFHPEYTMNKVYIENVEAEILSGTSKSLLVKVPFGPFPRGLANVSIKIVDVTGYSNSDFCIQDDWVMVSNSLPFNFLGDVGSFVIDNVAYVIAVSRDYSDTKEYLWEFDSKEYSWTKHSIPFEMMHTSVCVSNGSKGYVYTANAANNFWEFNPADNSWTRKTNFPGERRDGATSFSIGNNIFVGIGSDYYAGKFFHDFYKYDPVLNNWTRISDLDKDSPFMRAKASTFTIGNTAYLTCGATNTGMFDAWKYSNSTDQWVRIADFPDARSYTSAFTLNGKGYVANGTPVGDLDKKNCWEYDPLTNVWQPFYDVGHFGRYDGFSFSINGTAFVGGGDGWFGSPRWELLKLNK